MIRTPSNERPIRAVPETAQEENDESVPYNFRFRDAAAAQRDINIIPKPSRQGNVPTAPKLRNVAAEIRHVEVPHQLYAEQLGCAYGNVGIAREITVNLEGEKDGSKKQSASCLFRVSRENFVHIHSAIICYHYLLEQAPKDLTHTVNGCVIVEFALLQELRQEVRRTLDRAGNQLREKRDEGKKGNNVCCGLYLPSVNINGITQGLESVERNAYGENHFQQQPIRGNMKQLRKLGDKKVVILEDGQNQKVQNDIGRGYQLLPPL